ncbi:uncharacterized protein LOC134546360 [Bacillus rossius redtenbacheri]|uniref:uncharacterized protein LOC134546360 n=1 Tax=Bacillus rossius redtenbacheri TaxID=93214 RepID=UPI002FDDB5DD
MEITTPVPKPRQSPLHISESSMKKPIPLPRHKGETTKMSGINPYELEPENCTSQPNSSSSVCVEVNGKTQDILRKHDISQSKVKSVIETTHNVSLRLKSVRNMISRRREAQKSFPITMNADVKFERSQSLPTEDIFKTISFNSPINKDHNGTESSEEEIYEDESSRPPPPVYPPPPLPDESVYDELQPSSLVQVISSDEKNFKEKFEKDLNYENVCILGNRRVQVADNTDSSTTKPGNATIDRTSISRSDSWSFYDSVHENDFYANVPDKKICDVLNERSSSAQDSIFSKGSASSPTWYSASGSVSPSLLSELEALRYCSSDEESISSSLPSSFSVRNKLYENWDAASIKTCDSDISRASGRHAQQGKSVIYEFDPLFEMEEPCPSLVKDSELLAGSAGITVTDLKSALHSPYGRIAKSSSTKFVPCAESQVSTDQSRAYIVHPPSPPSRYETIALCQDSPDNDNQGDRIYANVEISRGQTSRSEESAESNQSVTSGDTDTSPPSVLADAPLSTVNVDSPEGDRLEPLRLTRGAATRGGAVLGQNKPGRVVRWESMKRALQRVAESPNWSPAIVRRSKNLLGGKNSSPEANQSSVFYDRMRMETATAEHIANMAHECLPHCGELFRVTGTSDRQKEVVSNWCILAEGKLSCFLDKTGSDIKDVIPLESIVSVNILPDYKGSNAGDEIHCFELEVSWKNRSYVFGSSSTTERRVWLQKIIESLTKVFPLRISSEFTRSGWCYLKEGINGIWNLAWLLLHQRTLFFCSKNGSLQECDLRKAISIVLQEHKGEDGAGPVVREKGPRLLVDLPGQTLYCQLDAPRLTEAWRAVLHAAAVNNGPNLAQQQLTRDDVPVVVEKCINFVYAHGSMSEGIYRRSGTNSNVTKLLALFRQDAWAVQISKQEYSEYDVSGVLKRFFIELPEPLFTTELHAQLCEIADRKLGKTEQDCLVHYRHVLEQLPPINFLTARRLIGHLYFIHELHERNLMPVENLAAIWGPTLMHLEDDEFQKWSKLESAVVADLIALYPGLFDVDAEELSKERRMKEVLEHYHTSTTDVHRRKPSGDLKMWVYLESASSSKCFSVTLSPQRQAGDVCRELAARSPWPAHQLCLEEVVLGGALVRPLHHSERVLDAVLRWSLWDDADCRDNCLVLTRCTLFSETHPFTKQPLTMCGELRFADQKSKSFRSYLFEFSQAKLCYYKDKRGSIKLNEWKIEDIVWYLGHEPKRDPQVRWSVTFIPKTGKPKRSKDSPYFGCTMAGTSKDEQLRWLSAMLGGEYPQGLLPPVVLLV